MLHTTVSRTLFFGISLSLILAMMAMPAFAAGGENASSTLHVLRPIINAEKAKAEICLEFDQPIVAQDGNARLSTPLSLKLESVDRKQKISPRTATYSGNLLCVPGLTHRTTYRLKLSSFTSHFNGKLGSPYSLSFTVPARRPMLAFAGDDIGAPVYRWIENPVLHSVNVNEAKLELFRVKDLPRMAEAWRLRAQTALAPSETATFAHANGELVWQGALAFDGKPNEKNEKKVPLPHDAEPGLYLAVASAPNLVTRKTELVPISAMWLLRSDLKIRLLQAEKGIYALAYNERTAQTLPNATVTAFDRSNQKASVSHTDASGIALIDKRAAGGSERQNAPLIGTIVVTDDRGQVGFADTEDNMAKRADYVLGPSEASMLVARGAYAPGATAEALLAAYDMRGKSLAIKDSTLQIVSRDGKIYAAHKVPETTNGKARVAFPSPMLDGKWTLVWRRNDGAELAKGVLNVTSFVGASQLGVVADRNKLMPDGEVTLTISGGVSPTQGKVHVEWKRVENIFSGWNGYVFGASPRENNPQGKFLTPDGAARSSLSFITDKRGVARLSARIAPPAGNEIGDEGSSSLWVAKLSIKSDLEAGVFDPPSLELPLKPARAVIGIKPLAPKAIYPENGLARFDVVALDGEGRRTEVDSLFYRVYEEGRRFDWYQNNGKWHYKLIPQRTRIEGGTLSIPASDDNAGSRLEIPVASGSYKIEIADSEGRILAKLPFSAGWIASESTTADAEPLALIVPPALRTGSEAHIRFKLERPAMVRTIIADDNIQKIMQDAKPKGNVDILFTPLPEWGKKIKITVEVETLATPQATMKGLAEIPIAATATPSSAPFTKKEMEDATSESLAAQSVKSGLALSEIQEALKQESSQSRKELPSEGTILNSVDRLLLPPQREWSPPEAHTRKKASDNALGQRKKNKGQRPDGKSGAIAMIAPAPIANVPTMLSSVLNRPPYTLTEIAGTTVTLNMWKDALTESGLAHEPSWSQRYRLETKRILNRQAPDGGFAAMPGEEPDIASTSAALSALAAQASPALAPAMTHAVEWLSRRLENAWFAESERPQRALAYGALARVGKLDVSNLRYFADTSADKELPPLASANVALAFARIDDKNQALFWIERTKTAIAREKEIEAAVKLPEEASDRRSGADEELSSPSSLAYVDTRPDSVAAWRTLAENRYVDAEIVMSEINRVSEAIFSSTDKKRSLNVINDLAWGMKAALDRMEPWRVSISGVDKRVSNGIIVAPLPPPVMETTAPQRTLPLIRNTSGKPIAVEWAQRGNMPSMRANLTRKILKMDGSPVRGEMQLHETYVMIVEGQWPESESSGLLVADALGPLFAPQSCAVDPTGEFGFLGWLKEWNISNVQHCERTPNGIYVRLSAPRQAKSEAEGKSANPWRVAWLAKARMRGSHMLPPPRLRALFQGARTYEGTSEKVNVR